MLSEEAVWHRMESRQFHNGSYTTAALLNDLVKCFGRAQAAASSRPCHGLANVCINADLRSHDINMISFLYTNGSANSDESSPCLVAIHKNAL